MDPNTKKYLTYGGVALAGFLVYKRWRHEDKQIDEIKRSQSKRPPEPVLSPAQIADQMPPSTSGQFSPVGYPDMPSYPSGYPQQPYQSPYVPPIGIPIGYPQQYPIQRPPYVQNCQILAQSVIGQTVTTARAAIYSQGYQARVVTINGRPVISPAPSYGPAVNLSIVNGIVRSATCA